jgi:hypothetical protein
MAPYNTNEQKRTLLAVRDSDDVITPAGLQLVRATVVYIG